MSRSRRSWVAPYPIKLGLAQVSNEAAAEVNDIDSAVRESKML